MIRSDRPAIQDVGLIPPPPQRICMAMSSHECTCALCDVDMHTYCRAGPLSRAWEVWAWLGAYGWTRCGCRCLTQHCPVLALVSALVLFAHVNPPSIYMSACLVPVTLPLESWMMQYLLSVAAVVAASISLGPCLVPMPSSVMVPQIANRRRGVLDLRRMR